MTLLIAYVDIIKYEIKYYFAAKYIYTDDLPTTYSLGLIIKYVSDNTNLGGND